GRHRRPDHRADLLRALGADLRPGHPQGGRLPVLLLLPARLHARSGHSALDRHHAAEEDEPMSNVNYVTFTILLVLFLLVTLIGFAAARWRRAEDMMHLNEWGLGGRGFGTFIGWFLIGGDL